ncbi:uncharacterized protein LOC127721739 [Mytilus californianus]|uniref:uncharacterized protein LOC127721739 n=1 Tax=Mytilus californianus TaxID=6549 RepID=UPI0022485239|nr:uncharacterized protein LOC127721739 [Mytilus californianus]
MAWFQIVSVLFIFITTTSGQCQYDTASAVCFCNKEVYVREVMIVEVMSENCDCIIHLVDFNEPPTVANMFNRECSWTCTNETCVPDNILEVFVTRKEKNPTKPTSETTTDHTEAWPTTRDSMTTDHKEAWPTTTVRVTTNSKEPHSEQKKDLGNYLEKMDVFMTVFWTVSGLFVAYISLVVGKMIYQSRQQKQPYLPITRSQQDSTVTTQIPTLDITPSFEIPTIIPIPEISPPKDQQYLELVH